MPGSATLDPDVLLEGLIPDVVDGLRSLNTDFGLRQWRVYSVMRKWSGGEVGSGSFTDTETEILPRPIVEPFESFHLKLEPCGMNEAGFLRMTEVSLTYTEAELGGGELPHGTQHLFKIVEAHGQATTTRYFVNRRPPYPDRIRTLGWLLHLDVANSAEPGPTAEDDALAAQGEAMPVTPGNALFDVLGSMAGAAASYSYICPAGKKAFIQRLTFIVRCASAPAAGEFGDQAALSTGCSMGFLDTDDSVLLDPLDGETIKRNEDWGMLAGAQLKFETSALYAVVVEWVLPRPIELAAAQKFKFTVADSLSALSDFRCQLQGYLEND